MTSSLDDSAALSRAKALVPGSLKRAANAGIRLGAASSAGLRGGPDVLIVGAKRAGTTFLWSALLDHPQVMPLVPSARHIKSPHWFTRHQRLPEAWWRGHFPTQIAKQRHRRRYGAALTVEANPLYLWDPRVVERMRPLVPDARVLVLLRDPVDRAYSHYRERVKAGVESLPFDAALAAEQGRLAGESARMRDRHYHARAWDWYSYRSRGEYAPQVARWLDAYGPDRVLVMRSEDMYANPSATVARVQDFVGLERCEPRSTRRNAAPGSGIDADSAADLRRHFGQHNKELARLLGTPVWWD